jgi:hypothetical protein
MILDGLPAKLRPPVQVIDDWVTNRRLALLVEARVSKGKLMVCSIDLERDLEANPVIRQFRASLGRYMNGAAFKPSVTISSDQVRGLFRKPTGLRKLGGKIIHTDSTHREHIGEQVPF